MTTDESPQRRHSVPCPICEAPVRVDATGCSNCGAKFESPRMLEDQLDDLSRIANQQVQDESGAPMAREPAHPSGPLKPVPKPTRAKGLTNGLRLGSRSGPKTGRTNGVGGRTNGLRGRTNGLTNGLRGRTNGLTNGLGRTNGLTNGVGRTNGLTDRLGSTSGLTNGLGRTNGLTNGLGRTNGLTNGLGGVRVAGLPFSRRRGTSRTAGWKLYLIPLVSVALLLVPLFFVQQQGASYPIQIDGQFGDWASVSKVNGAVPSIALNPDINITRVAVKDNLDYLSFYVAVQGNALGGGPAPARITNAFYALIDVDRSASTGYRVQGIGADRMVRVNTWGGQVVSAGLMAYNVSRSPTDWNGWIPIGPVNAAGSGGQLEFETPWRDLSQTPVPMDVAFASRSWDGQSDAGDVVVTNVEPFVVVTQSTNAPAFVSGTGTNLAQLTVHSVDGTVTVDAVNVTFTGTFGPSSISAVDLVDASAGVLSSRPIAPLVDFGFTPIPLVSGDTRTFSVRPHVSSPDGTTVGAFVRNVEDVTVSGGGVAFVGPRTTPASLAYVGTVPSGPRIDGAFGEWANATPDPVGDVVPIADRDVDLNAYGFRGFSGSTYLMASVAGTALNGTMVPALNPAYTPASGSTGNGTVGPAPPPVNGTDFIRFFVDADGNASTGYGIGGLGADYLVEITGKDGLILSSQAMRFSGATPSDWKWNSLGTAQALKDQAHIETVLTGVVITNGSRAYFQASAWNGAHDDSAPTTPPISVLSAMSVQVPAASAPSTTAPSPSGSFELQTQDISGNQQWFFRNTASTGIGCTSGNNLDANTTAGASATSTDLTGTQSICWFTALGQPASTISGTWEFYRDISVKTNATQVLHTASNGNVNQWASVGTGCTGGTNQWKCVNDDPNDGNGSYIYSTSASVQDSQFIIAIWPAPPSPLSIINVTVEGSCYLATGTTSDVRLTIRPASTIIVGPTRPTCPTTGSTYKLWTDVWSTNPSTGVAWTLADLNSLQIGVRDNDTTTNQIRVSSVRAIVYFTPAYSVQIDFCTKSDCSGTSSLLSPVNSNTFGNDVLTTATIGALTLTSSNRIRFELALLAGGVVTVSYNGPYPGTADSRGTISVSIPEFHGVVVPITTTLLMATIVRWAWLRRSRQHAARSSRSKAPQSVLRSQPRASSQPDAISTP